MDASGPEKENYRFLLAVTLLHELAHWLGSKIHGIEWQSNENLGEPGYFIEERVFGGRVCFFGPGKFQPRCFVIKHPMEDGYYLLSENSIRQFLDGMFFLIF